MPCRDYTIEDEWRDRLSSEMAMLRASLCAVLTVIDTDDTAFNAFLKKINWREAGVTKRELMLWWEKHQEEDRVRKEREAKRKEEERIRKEALSKLTEYEKKILGIK
jgi:hypothetical protein